MSHYANVRRRRDPEPVYITRSKRTETRTETHRSHRSQPRQHYEDDYYEIGVDPVPRPYVEVHVEERVPTKKKPPVPEKKSHLKFIKNPGVVNPTNAKPNESKPLKVSALFGTGNNLTVITNSKGKKFLRRDKPVWVKRQATLAGRIPKLAPWSDSG
jgi:hypothetical protein